MHTIKYEVALFDGDDPEQKKTYVLTPPRGWALDLIAQAGIDYLRPKYPDRRVKTLDGEPVMDGENFVFETVLSPVPPDMTVSRLTGITMAALLSQADGLDANKVPVHIWTPEEALDVIPPEAMEAFAALCATLVTAAFPKPSADASPRKRRPKKANRGGAKRSGARRS